MLLLCIVCFFVVRFAFVLLLLFVQSHSFSNIGLNENEWW